MLLQLSDAIVTFQEQFLSALHYSYVGRETATQPLRLAKVGGTRPSAGLRRETSAPFTENDFVEYPHVV